MTGYAPDLMCYRQRCIDGERSTQIIARLSRIRCAF
jgi:hypothetical protein